MGRFSLKRLFGRDDPDDDLSWLCPPQDIHDPVAWDRYWKGFAASGIGPGLQDMMAGDPETAKAMAEIGVHTVLCAGSGWSQEPRALAEAGFEVISVDLSPVAVMLAQAWEFGPADLERFLLPDQRKDGGSVRFLTGDLLDPLICPGPFDMIIERCTLQNFSDEERGRALDALVSRLKKDGIFLSHCHDGGWRPDREPVHATRQLFVERGWTIWSRSAGHRPAGRAAWIYQTTG
jgi:SAM-dependent methyltransferase